MRNAGCKATGIHKFRTLDGGRPGETPIVKHLIGLLSGMGLPLPTPDCNCLTFNKGGASNLFCTAGRGTCVDPTRDTRNTAGVLPQRGTYTTDAARWAKQRLQWED
eukprot:gene25325-biopygen22483